MLDQLLEDSIQQLTVMLQRALEQRLQQVKERRQPPGFLAYSVADACSSTMWSKWVRRCRGGGEGDWDQSKLYRGIAGQQCLNKGSERMRWLNQKQGP